MNSGSLRHAAWLVAVPAILIALAVFGAARIERGSSLHSNEALSQQQELLTAMLDQETGARGFFQTLDASFLQPWYRGAADFASTLGAAERAVAGDSRLTHDLQAQAQLAARWHTSAAATVAAVLHGRRLPPLSAAVTRKALMDRFRAANAAYGTDLQRRRGTILTRATLISVGLAGGVAALIALAGWFLLRQVTRRQETRRRSENELRELLQVSDSEQESRRLLIRHIERAIPGAGAAVLNRNNSDDRLEPSLDEHAGRTPLRDLPAGALAPRSCLAVRLSRPYERRRGDEPLAQCEVCGLLAADIACEPLLVGGLVIGSVLVATTGRITDTARREVRDAVVQAAPIIANQRNLSLAEMRAASDALTGLPNRRAADDTLKRMAAHASRSVSPLTAILLDLDRFKQINDVHGHDQGDEALAAVGAALSSTLRASDFAARHGGEEFLVLLPDTNREQARVVAEKLRKAISEIELRTGAVTASLGVASIPEDAVDPEQLLRKADRALYVAKHNGRDRVELAASLTAAEQPHDDPAA